MTEIAYDNVDHLVNSRRNSCSKRNVNYDHFDWSTHISDELAYLLVSNLLEQRFIPSLQLRRASFDVNRRLG
jgi:hypothetical protein